MDEHITTIASNLAEIVSVLISIFALVVSGITWTKDKSKEKMNLGINFDNDLLADTESKALFIKMHFINNSSISTTVYNLKILNEHKQPYNDYTENKYPVAQGDIIPLEIKVKDFMNVPKHKIKETPYKSCLLPITIQPYSGFSGYFAFYFEGHDSNTMKYKSDNNLLIQTTQGNVLYPLDTSVRFYQVFKDLHLDIKPYTFYKKRRFITAKIKAIKDKIKGKSDFS
ncbi:hypothetical protein [Lactococcus taiwanensis]|uniref:hypothetical protein n=1 Tax=Lactococcus taiwanensis TaxID=1151742 RepID=UPI0035135AF9